MRLVEELKFLRSNAATRTRHSISNRFTWALSRESCDPCTFPARDAPRQPRGVLNEGRRQSYRSRRSGAPRPKTAGRPHFHDRSIVSAIPENETCIASTSLVCGSVEGCRLGCNRIVVDTPSRPATQPRSRLALVRRPNGRGRTAGVERT